MFMKTFEEKWTAWLDGELSGAELAEFEASLPDKAAAEAEKRDAQKLGAFLKEQLQAPRDGERGVLPSSTARANRSAMRGAGANVPGSRREAAWWSIGRLVWTGAASLAIFAVCTFFVMREKTPTDQSQYLTQILNARVDPEVSPDATISMFESKEDKVTVLWVDGLQSLPVGIRREVIARCNGAPPLLIGLSLALIAGSGRSAPARADGLERAGHGEQCCAADADSERS